MSRQVSQTVSTFSTGPATENIARQKQPRIQSAIHSRHPTQPEPLVTTTCPWCSAPRDTGPTCPRCGADYAKAEAIKKHGRAAHAVGQPEFPIETHDVADPVHVPAAPDEWQAVSDPELEWKFCLGAIPIALCIAMAFQATGPGAALQRIFLTMPVHELGHAVTAWFCGYTAIPTLWKTLIPDARGFIAPLALLGACGFLTYRAYLARELPVMYTVGALIFLQMFGTIIIKPDTALMLITFGGDGMGMILATLLMSSFFFGKHTQLYKGSLRWGFVVIGAAAFIDIYATWWRARKDDNAIPYGTTGGMATDSMTLVDTYGWSLQTLVHRYVVLGLCCLVVLTLVYAWGVWRAKSEMATRKRAQRMNDWEQRKRKD